MSYLGSKAASGAFQKIIAKMPPHDCYIETHLGTGAVLFNKPLSNHSFGIDVDSGVIKAAKNKDTNNQHKILNKCALQFLSEFDFNSAGRVLCYCDPPYLLSTRTSNSRYRHDYNDLDHERLLNTLLLLSSTYPNVSIILSGYPSDYYNEKLIGWHTSEFQVMTRGGVRTEKIWMNYQCDSAHWASYAGRNFTERQNIKRKASRWAKNYKKLSPGEKIAVLAAMLEHH